MSTYNGEKFLEKQIESILNQTGDIVLDLLVRDDGSTDKTISILKSYASKGLLQWYSGQQIGPAKSFFDLFLKKGMENYTYYAFADQDDYWNSNKISSAIDKIDKLHGPVLYCSNADLVDEKLNSLGRKVYRKSPAVDFYTISCAGGLLGCTMVLNNDLYKIIHDKKCPDKIIMHDFYVAQVCTAMNGKVYFDERSFIRYRQHSNNTIGVSHGLYKTIMSRLGSIMSPSKLSIADQANTIIDIYGDFLQSEKKLWLKFIMNYRSSIIRQVQLAFSKKIRDSRINMSITLRLSILFGNR